MNDPVSENPPGHALTVASNEAADVNAGSKESSWVDRPWVVDFMLLFAWLAIAGYACGFAVTVFFFRNVPGWSWLEIMALCFFGIAFLALLIKAVKRRSRLAWYAVLFVNCCQILISISTYDNGGAKLKSPGLWGFFALIIVYYWLKPETKAWFAIGRPKNRNTAKP